MKRLSALLGLVLAVLLRHRCRGHPAQAQIANINDAINKAGSLRYAANRLAKVYFQIGMGIEVDRSKRILDSQIAMYDRRVVELKNYAPTPEIKESYINLEKAWSGYKDLLVGAKPNPEAGRKLVGVSEEVVAIANKATGQLAAHSGTTEGKPGEHLRPPAHALPAHRQVLPGPCLGRGAGRLAGADGQVARRIRRRCWASSPPPRSTPRRSRRNSISASSSGCSSSRP
jgi:hypothetical protein